MYFFLFNLKVASLADAILVRHAILEERLRDETKERLRGKLT